MSFCFVLLGRCVLRNQSFTLRCKLLSSTLRKAPKKSARNFGRSNGPSNWRMLYGLDVNSEKGLVLVADNFGFLYLVDIRSNNKVGKAILIHKKGSKVVGLHCNPVQPDLLLSCGNDHFVRIWDMCRLEVGSSL